MDGILTLQGYKFTQKIHLNFQDRTIIIGDSYLCHEVLNMLEQYFNRKNFSDYYLHNNLSLVFNGKLVAPSEYLVFRISPLANLVEEIKLAKKSLLGQVLSENFAEDTKLFVNTLQALQEDVLQKANQLTQQYSIHFVPECPDIFTMAKIFSPQIYLNNHEEILPQEQEQFLIKKMLIQFIAQLKVNKKKLLLIELPEYALTPEQCSALCQEIQQASIDKIILYSNNATLINIFPHIFSYHLAISQQIYGFDDYDYLEKTLLEITPTLSKQELMTKVLNYIFARDHYPEVTAFTRAIENFFQSQQNT